MTPTISKVIQTYVFWGWRYPRMVIRYRLADFDPESVGDSFRTGSVAVVLSVMFVPWSTELRNAEDGIRRHRRDGRP